MKGLWKEGFQYTMFPCFEVPFRLVDLSRHFDITFFYLQQQQVCMQGSCGTNTCTYMHVAFQDTGKPNLQLDKAGMAGRCPQGITLKNALAFDKVLCYSHLPCLVYTNKACSFFPSC